MEFCFGPPITALQRVASEVKNIKKLERGYTREAEYAEREINAHLVKARNLGKNIRDGMVRQQILGELRLAEQKRQRAESYRAFARTVAEMATKMHLQSGEIQLHTSVVNASMALIRQSQKFHPRILQNVIKDFTISGEMRQGLMSDLEGAIHDQTEETLGGDEEASEILNPQTVEERAMSQLQLMEREAGLDPDQLIEQMPSVSSLLKKKATPQHAGGGGGGGQKK